MREWLMRVASIGRRGRRDRELDDELRFHADQLAREFERRGLDAEAARQAAARELGGVGRTKQAWRDQRSWLPLEEVVQDIRYGLRVLRRSRGVSAAAALMLAVAVAAITSLFAVVDAVLLAPLPFLNADRLVVVFEAWRPQHADTVSVTPGTFLEWQDRAHQFTAFTAVDARRQNLTGITEPEQVAVAAVSRGFAATVGIQPVVGRMFAAEEFEPGRERVALISHPLWTTRFGGAPVVGLAIVLDDQPYTIVGVMPSGFMFPQPDQQVWVPMPMTAADRANLTGHVLRVVARVRPGVPIPAATAELRDVAAVLARDFPDSKRDWDVNVVPARLALVGDTATVLEAMMGAVVLLLAVACANVAGLLLTHGASRTRELAVRAAVGASRPRIVRQLLTESVVLAAIGAGLGVALAWAAQPVVDALRPADLLTWKPIAIDARALGFAALVALTCGSLFGIVPALLGSQASIAAAASDRTVAWRTSRLRQVLIASEIAMAVVLVSGAALFGRTLSHLAAVDPGFRPEGVVTMRLALPPSRYDTDARVDGFYRSVLDSVRALPGVRAAGAIQALPLSGNTSVRPYDVVDRSPAKDPPVAHYRIVTAGYFEAMRIPLIAGRTFIDADTADRPLAVVVNQTLKRLAWGDRSAVGQRITFGGQLASSRLWAAVVGVVGDVRHFGPGNPPVPEMYWASAQIDVAPGETLRTFRRNSTLVVAAASGDGLALVPAVRAAVKAVDPNQPIANVHTMTSLMSTSLYLPRASAWLLTLFGSAALAFALLGVFGASAYTVAQRRRELAIRLALGARPRRLPWMVVGDALYAGAAGVVVGVALSVVLRRAVATLLVGVDGGVSVTLAAVSATLLVTTAAACWVAARRAAAIDAMRTLRTE